MLYKKILVNKNADRMFYSDTKDWVINFIRVAGGKGNLLSP